MIDQEKREADDNSMAEAAGKEHHQKSSGLWKYLAVILAGLLVVGAALFLIPKTKENENPSGRETSANANERTSDEIPGSTPKTPEDTKASGEDTPGHSDKEDVKTSAEEAETKETDKDTPDPSSGSAGTPVDSFYQYVSGYTWEDLYTLILLISPSSEGITEGSDGKNAAFSIFRIREDCDPLIFIGFNDPETHRNNMALYITDGGFVYELLRIRESDIFIDPEDGTILIPEDRALYRYTPHVLLKEERNDASVPEGFVRLPVSESKGIVVTSQNIDAYVNDYTGGKP